MPRAPRAVISAASLSSATRRAASLSTMTTAATFASLTSSGCASGARHEDTKAGVVEHAARSMAARTTILAVVRMSVFLLATARKCRRRAADDHHPKVSANQYHRAIQQLPPLCCNRRSQSYPHQEFVMHIAVKG